MRRSWPTVATSAVPVAVKTTGVPVRPGDGRGRVFVPAVVPSVHDVSVAIPELFVVTVEPLTGERRAVPGGGRESHDHALDRVVVRVADEHRRGGDGRADRGRLTRRSELATMFCAVAARAVA